MNNSQKFFLIALYNAPESKLHAQIALDIWTSPVYQSDIKKLIEDKYITEQGEITEKGRLSLATDVSQFTNTYLSISLVKHLREAVKRGILRNERRSFGSFHYMSDTEIASVLENLMIEVCNRVEQLHELITEEVSAILDSGILQTQPSQVPVGTAVEAESSKTMEEFVKKDMIERQEFSDGLL